MLDRTDKTTSCCRGTSIHFGTRFESNMKLLDMSFNKSLLHLDPWCNFNILGRTTLGSCNHCHRLDSYSTKFVKVRLQFGIVSKKIIIFKISFQFLYCFISLLKTCNSLFISLLMCFWILKYYSTYAKFHSPPFFEINHHFVEVFFIWVFFWSMH